MIPELGYGATVTAFVLALWGAVAAAARAARPAPSYVNVNSGGGKVGP